MSEIWGRENMDKKEIEFKFERATKNTYRFQEKSSGTPIIGTLYIQKSVFGSKEPKKVKVTGGVGVIEMETSNAENGKVGKGKWS